MWGYTDYLLHNFHYDEVVICILDSKQIHLGTMDGSQDSNLYTVQPVCIRDTSVCK